eukprot:TRINITY_DN469_c4_g1_i1.p1 TRINITY_DN469_c4_g1~~TRINITY_DN469_c4_g1_i1.p1  ORF type:complete len:334 (+),score=76.98 TRINITY_DN469_c4_g1_i1:36-1037(+)
MRSNIFFVALLLIVAITTAYSAPLKFTGCAESCAEFGANVLPGVYGKNYIYPSNFSIDHLNSVGMNLFRIPFLWERMQPTLNQPLDPQQLAYLTSTVHEVTVVRGAYALLDPHNYARYRGQVIGSGAVPNSAFADFWRRLATQFKSNNKTIFGLMNEPNSMPTEQWLSAANAAIAAIRSTGANNLLTVPGNAWTGAASWTANWYGTSNAVVMKNVVDPIHNFVFEVHQYFDSDGSGTHPDCPKGPDTLNDFTQWCKQNNFRGFLGEFAGGDNSQCQQVINGVFSVMEANADVWSGFSWWAAGPWWGNYMYSIEPDSNGTDKPQMAWIKPHLQH